MKRRSATRTPPLSQPEHAFFTDRDLGKQFPKILRQADIEVRAYFEEFPTDDAVEDPQWILRATELGLIGITNDWNLRKERDAQRMIVLCSARIFIMRTRDLTHPQSAEIFVQARVKVERLLRKHDGPFIARVWRKPTKSGYVPSAKIWKKGAEIYPEGVL